MLGPDFNGTVEMYDASNDTWESVEVGSGIALRPLDVLRVTPETDTVAVLTFQVTPGGGATDGDGTGGDGSGDGPGDKPPENSDGRVILDRGQNVIAAATYNPVETAFVTPSDSISTVTSLAAGPESQLGPAGDLDGTHRTTGAGEGPAVSPFAGYVVVSDRPSPVEVSLETNPTVYELYLQLGLESPSLTGLNTNLTTASSVPIRITGTTATVKSDGTTLLHTHGERTTNATDAYGQLVDAGHAAAERAATNTTDRPAIERAVVEAVIAKAKRWT